MNTNVYISNCMWNSIQYLHVRHIDGAFDFLESLGKC